MLPRQIWRRVGIPERLCGTRILFAEGRRGNRLIKGHGHGPTFRQKHSRKRIPKLVDLSGFEDVDLYTIDTRNWRLAIYPYTNCHDLAVDIPHEAMVIPTMAQIRNA